MYNNNEQIYTYVEERSRRRSRRSGRGQVLLIILLALIAGFVGGQGAVTLSPPKASTDAPPAPTVVLQMVATEDQAGPLPTAFEDTAVFEEIAAKAAPTVVEVSTESKVTHPFFGSYITGGAGSGVVISQNGYIITNDHVVSSSDTIAIRTPDGTIYAATLVGADSQTDLAVLKIPAENLPAAVFADSDAAVVGQPVVAIGNPLGTLGGTITEGIISAKGRELVIGNESMVLLQTSAAINPGNSGGGLFDRHSHLVGIVNAKSSGSDIEGIGFAIPANTVKSVASDLISNGYVTNRPSLGISVEQINSREAFYLYRLSKGGIYVLSAQEQGPFQKWDRLVSFNHETIESITDLKRQLSQHNVGDSVEVTVERGGHSYSLSVVLTEQQPNHAGS